VSTDISDERLNRALTAFLRQEVQAPADAITNFLDIIIEDARRLQMDLLTPDLDRMRDASIHLSTFVKSLLAGAWAADETIEGFQKRVRHDLRNPLNAIKGYSELLLEDMDDEHEHPLKADLTTLKSSADQLLAQIDGMFALRLQEQARSAHDPKPALARGTIANVLRSVAPLEPSDAPRDSVPSSHILVVDDNAANRDVLARRLVREGHKVATAPDAAAALDMVVKAEFDLVLLDLIMPGMSGFEMLRRLKVGEHTREIPVIVISALDEMDSVVRCIEAGAEDYLTKPFNPVLLRARINASLEKKFLRDREKKFIQDLEQERQRSESLLLNILPQKIIDRLRRGETVIADRVLESTIMFCDLVGFTPLSHELPADRMVDLLGTIFSSFDHLAAEHGVEKIKTIGDAYMVAAGIPEHQADHAVRVATLAPRMLASVSDIAQANNLSLQARIGIHTGPIVAGVIGTRKFAYDVWGDTVNTASRMESHSLPGRIQVSLTTRLALPDHFKFDPRGTLDIKGKGLMKTFFLTV
jgi:class 3 adenylate cyclase